MARNSKSEIERTGTDRVFGLESENAMKGIKFSFPDRHRSFIGGYRRFVRNHALFQSQAACLRVAGARIARPFLIVVYLYITSAKGLISKVWRG